MHTDERVRDTRFFFFVWWQARWCGKVTLPADGGGRTQTNAYMTQEHHQLFYHCALTLLREYKGQVLTLLAFTSPKKRVRILAGEHHQLFFFFIFFSQFLASPNTSRRAPPFFFLITAPLHSGKCRGQVLLYQQYSVYLLYWCKSTNIDAELLLREQAIFYLATDMPEHVLGLLALLVPKYKY